MRVVHQVHLEPLDRDLFAAMIDHGLAASGATLTAVSTWPLSHRRDHGAQPTRKYE
jgi:hypothetical protein